METLYSPVLGKGTGQMLQYLFIEQVPASHNYIHSVAPLEGILEQRFTVKFQRSVKKENYFY